MRGSLRSSVQEVRISMKTYMAKKGDVEARWYVVDLDGAVLGRAAQRIAQVLTGKHRPEFTPHVDTGDFVIVLNADKVRVTGGKLDQKLYDRYSGYPSGRRTHSLREILAAHPERVVLHAVKGMLPKTRLGRVMLKKLKVYAGSDHPHQAQMPEKLEI